MKSGEVMGYDELTDLSREVVRLYDMTYPFYTAWEGFLRNVEDRERERAHSS